MKHVTIGITDCSKFKNYHDWIAAEPNVEVIRLSHQDNNSAAVDSCDAVLLSGGEDVHPRYYNKVELLDLCDEIDERRDEFEWTVLDRTIKSTRPLLGICRGLQVVNVYLGGTLLPHIPRTGKFNHSRWETADRYHKVTVDANSRLGRIAGLDGEVNSAHHQAADIVAKPLVVNALSPDGIVEGLELIDPGDDRFLMLVQWHPERMNNLESNFSKKVKEAFIHAARNARR